MSYGNGWSLKPEHQRIAKFIGWTDLADEQMKRCQKTLWKNELGGYEPHCRNYDYDCEAVYLLTTLKKMGYNVSLWMNPKTDDWVVTLLKHGKIQFESVTNDIAQSIQEVVNKLIDEKENKEKLNVNTETLNYKDLIIEQNCEKLWEFIEIK